jgi:hypothetical protein
VRVVIIAYIYLSLLLPFHCHFVVVIEWWTDEISVRLVVLAYVFILFRFLRDMLR